jgi:rhodanese-related sulfurtransferase
MKTLVLLLLVVGVFFIIRHLLAGPSISPAEAAARVAAGKAVLIDVREPGEWTGGVAEPALLCSLSDLRSARTQWKPVLEANREKELILYCASGARSGLAAGMLRKEGFSAVNGGGFGGWRGAGLPVRLLDQATD